MKKLLWLILLVLVGTFFALILMYQPVKAANTIVVEGGVISIVSDGSTDWSWTDDISDRPNGITVYSIQFCPSATADQMIIHNGTLDSVPIFDSGIVTGTDCIIKYFPSPAGYGKRAKPVIDASDITLDTAADAVTYIEYD